MHGTFNGAVVACVVVAHAVNTTCALAEKPAAAGALVAPHMQRSQVRVLEDESGWFIKACCVWFYHRWLASLWLQVTAFCAAQHMSVVGSCCSRVGMCLASATMVLLLVVCWAVVPRPSPNERQVNGSGMRSPLQMHRCTNCKTQLQDT
jgi:hypothetical protein